MVDLLSIEDPQEISMLFEVSGKLRHRYFGIRIFLYGFIYTSTYCRNDCNFCFFRRSNADSTRYRKTKLEILSAAKKLAERKDQDFDTRMVSKLDAYSHGLLIEEGLLCDIGETSEDLAYSLQAMKEIRADQVRAMTLNPQPGTPMATMPHMGFHREALLIAVMRLVSPDLLIPASLDVDGIEGIKHRLDASANVITSIVPQGAGLAGVARPSLGIEDGHRTVSSVAKMLTMCGLEVANQKEYLDWINSRQRIANPNTYHRLIA